MNRVKSLALIVFALAAVSPAMAQFPGGPGGGGRPALPPAVLANMQAWRTWRQNHPRIQALQAAIRGLAELDSAPTTHFTKHQARVELAVIQAWSPKPALSESQAQKVTALLTQPLTPAQTAAVAAASQRRGFGGGFGGPGGHFGGGGGFGGHGGQGGHFGGGGGFGGPRGQGGVPNIPAPHDYNPLNASTIPPGRGSRGTLARLAALIAALKADAH